MYHLLLPACLLLLCNSSQPPLMDRRKLETPQSEMVRIVLELLEAAITSIVFLKSVYPSGAFERRRYMGIAVPRARHPELRDYIHSSVSGLRPFVDKGLVERVSVIFFDSQQVPVEKFVFKLSLNLSDSSMAIEENVEFAFKSFLVKLSVSEPLTKTLPHDCRWEIAAYFRSIPQGGSKEGVAWIPTDTKQWQHCPSITPVKSISSKPLSLQLYLEHPSPTEPQDGNP